MTPATPTPEEIKAAYHAITKDGPFQTDALNIAFQDIGHNWLRHHREVSASPPTLSTESAHFEAIVITAMVYGINLGLRIGEARHH